MAINCIVTHLKNKWKHGKLEGAQTGYGVTVARVLWEDLVSVQIRVPRKLYGE